MNEMKSLKSLYEYKGRNNILFFIFISMSKSQKYTHKTEHEETEIFTQQKVSTLNPDRLIRIRYKKRVTTYVVYDVLYLWKWLMNQTSLPLKCPMHQIISSEIQDLKVIINVILHL